MHISSDIIMMDNKKKNKKKEIKNKIKNECAFLYYIAYNKDEKQTKEFLRYFTNSMQYTLLRELVVNDLAENCKAQPRCASLGYPFCNMAAHMEATPTREGI